MYALAPYFIRCFNPYSDSENREEHYDFLNRVGQYDTYKLTLEFLTSHKNFKTVENSKQTYKFLKIKNDDQARTITGMMCVGEYGLKNDIIDTNDSQIAFQKETNHADVRNYYFKFYLPLESRKGIALLYTYKSDGVKSIFYSEFNEYFKNKTKKNIQFQTLSYDRALTPWLDADIKEIKVFGFKPQKNIEDMIDGLGDSEHEFVIKAKRNKILGKFRDFRNKDSEQYNLVEVLRDESKQIKTTVSMNGSKKTFVVGNSGKQAFCQIEIDLEKVDVIAGNPDYGSLDIWATGIMKDIIKTINL